MIIRRKLYSFLSRLIGENKKVKKLSEEIIEEFRKQKTINQDAMMELKRVIPSTMSVPEDLKHYLSFIYENYRDTEVILVNKNGKETKTVLSWNEIIKKIQRYRKTFNTNKNNALIFLTSEISNNNSSSFLSTDEYYYCYFPKADGIWLFLIQWGNMSQGLYGIRSKDNKLLSDIELMLE